MGEVKITDLGLASPRSEFVIENGNGDAKGREGLSKEDQRAAELAERAQRGDYDDGMLC